MPHIKVSIILIQKCLVAPTCINAATGGRKIERIIFAIFILHLLKKNRISLIKSRVDSARGCFTPLGGKDTGEKRKKQRNFLENWLIIDLLIIRKRDLSID